MGSARPGMMKRLFCSDKVRYVGDEIAAVAAVDLETAMEAVSLIQVDYEELPSLLSVEAARAEGAPLIHEDFPGNICAQVHQEFGKEVGEGAIIPTIPAILNAVYDATGIRFHELPLTPERVCMAIQDRRRDGDVVVKEPHPNYLATKPNRFIYVHTPLHGSWLNLVETLFGKMARTFLKHIRVQSLKELKDRILLGIQEINAAPVIHRWKKFDAVAKY